MTSSTLLPMGLALTASFLHATSSSFARAGIRTTPTSLAVQISLTVNILVLWGMAALWNDLTFDPWAWRFFIIAGIFAPVLGRFLNYAAIERLGLNISSPITYTDPLVAMILAIAFLGEQLPGVGLFGGFLVILGGILLGSARGGDTPHPQKKYFFLPVLAAFCYGCSALFRKVGIDRVPSPLVAAAVTTTTSWILLVPYILLKELHRARSLSGREIVLFSFSGLATSFAIPTGYLALQTGTVLLVAPFNNVSPLFVLCLSAIFFRREELFSFRVIGGTTLILMGIILLTTLSKMG